MSIPDLVGQCRPLCISVDGQTTDYSYDAANELLQAGDTSYSYDNNGNLVSKTTGTGAVKYAYTGDNHLQSVTYPDGTGVTYAYDAFGHEVTRVQKYYALANNAKDANHGHHGQGNQGNGKGNYSTNPGVDNGKGKGKAKVHINHGQGESSRRQATNASTLNPYRLETETSHYLYDGDNVFKEYGANGQPLAEYYMGNGQVIARQMFGLHDLKEFSYEGNIQTLGGLMYYEYDGEGNVMDVTNRLGENVMSYRYDAFGDLFTQMAAPYNADGYTGKMYDAKASLMNYSARWYSPAVGRFTTEDTYPGTPDSPLSQNPYIYVDDTR